MSTCIVCIVPLWVVAYTERSIAKMEHRLLTVILLCLTVQIIHANVPYDYQERKVEQICSDIITANPAALPGLVRLAFHDCVGDGGCNGCINLENGDNAGLQAYIDMLEDAFVENKIRDLMSRADFWILCSHVALTEGQRRSERAEDADSLLLNMVYGREDCHPTNPDQTDTDSFPSPHGNYQNTTSYFGDQFGLTPNETVALLGAHTLGRARATASGFQNQWVDGEDKFDNEFYKDILNKTLSWTLVDLDGDNNNKTTRLQWSQYNNGNYKNLMFTSDLCLAYDVEADNDGRVNETFEQLGQSAGDPLVKIYAQDNAKWLSDFSLAYRKMVKKVSGNISLLLARPGVDNSVCQDTTNPQSPQTTTAGSTTNHVSLQLLLITLLSLFRALL